MQRVFRTFDVALDSKPFGKAFGADVDLIAVPTYVPPCHFAVFIAKTDLAFGHVQRKTILRREERAVSLAVLRIKFYWKLKELNGVLEGKKDLTRDVERIKGFSAGGEVFDFGLKENRFLDFGLLRLRLLQRCADMARRVFLIFRGSPERGRRQYERSCQSRAINQSPFGTKGTHAHLPLRVARKGSGTDKRKGCSHRPVPAMSTAECKQKTKAIETPFLWRKKRA